MQILNAIAEPSNAITVSNDGTKMARRTISRTVKKRVVARKIVRVVGL